MKKILSALLSLIMVLSVLTLVACTGNNGNSDDTSKTNDSGVVIGGDDTTYPDQKQETTNPEDNRPSTELVFTEVHDKVKVTATAANIRSDTLMTDDAIYTQVKKDTVLERTGYSGSWYRVNYDGKVCYIKSSVVMLVEDETTYEATKTMYIKTATLSVRSSADFSGNTDNVIGYLYYGDTVDVYAEGDGWYRILFKSKWYPDGIEAFIGAKFVTADASEITTAADTTAN